VGIEPRNTFAGDNFRSVDLSFSRAFLVRETKKLEVIAEAFNLFNTTNIRFFNTAYGAADFWPHFRGIVLVIVLCFLPRGTANDVAQRENARSAVHSAGSLLNFINFGFRFIEINGNSEQEVGVANGKVASFP